MKTYTLRFAQQNKDIFDAIKNGIKKVETRAGSIKYQHITVGDILILSCGNKKFKKTIKKVSHFKSVSALVKKYSPKQINSHTTTEKQLTEEYYSYPNYKEKIKKFGILAFELI